jgi:hypothetical protein
MTDEQPDLGRWQPWNPHEAAAFFAAVQAPWWISGGWAIDLFLGKQTREHDDLDVQFLRRDQQAIRALVGTWDVQAALPPPRDETWPFRPWRLNEELDLAIHDIWCRPDATQPWAFQLMVADTRDEWWLFRRMPAITRAIETIGGFTEDGIPFLAPEIQLLYKAKGLRPKDEADFSHTLPTFSQKQRAWLEEALSQVHLTHPWLERLIAYET